MFGISGNVLCNAGPGLPRPSIIIYSFFPLAIGSRCFSCLRFTVVNSVDTGLCGYR